MNITNYFSKLFKKEVESSSISELTRRDNLEMFFNSLSNSWSHSQLINKIGGIQNFDLLKKDTDIFQAIDKRIAALLDTDLAIEGKDKRLVEFFTYNILPHEDQLKKDLWWTQFNGYGVEQIIYKQTGEIEAFIREDFWRFEPLLDLTHVKLKFSNDSNLRNKVMLFEKYLLTTNDGTISKPMGEPLAEKLILPWLFKIDAEDLWTDFARRFANGYIKGKAPTKEDGLVLFNNLMTSLKSGIVVTDPDSDVEMIQPNRDPSFYEAMSGLAVKRITKAILGETQTSDMENRGSSQSATIHNEVRLEKTRADIKLIEKGINDIILKVALVNNFIPDSSYQHDLPKAKIIYDPDFNLELAERDSRLISAGVKFKKQYFIDNYALKEDHFDVVDIQPSQFPFKESSKRTFLSKEQELNYLSNNKVELAGNKEVDELSQFLSRNKSTPIGIDTLLAAIDSCGNESELDEKLASLLGSQDNDFLDDFTKANYAAAVLGARKACPIDLRKEDK